MGDVLYKKGDHVVYGINGICVISDVKNMMLSPIIGERKYYVLNRISGASTIYVSCDNEALVGKMRYVLNKQEIIDVLKDAKNSSVCWIDDKKERARKFAEVLRDGEYKDILPMIRCIYLKKQEYINKGKNLSDSDKSILSSAENKVIDEFSFALGIKEHEVGEFIRKELDIV